MQQTMWLSKTSIRFFFSKMDSKNSLLGKLLKDYIYSLSLLL